MENVQERAFDLVTSRDSVGCIAVRHELVDSAASQPSSAQMPPEVSFDSYNSTSTGSTHPRAVTINYVEACGLRDGDEHVWNSVVRRIWAALARDAARVSYVGTANADDIVVSAVMRVHRVRERIDPDKDVGGLFFAATRTAALDFGRGTNGRHLACSSYDDLVSDESWQPHCLYEDLHELSADAGEVALKAAALQSRNTAVREAVERLSHKSREVIELRYVHGLKGREIAARLGVPEGTVKGRTRLAIQQLRLLLGGANLDDSI